MRARDKAGGSVADIEVDFTELAHLVATIRALADELSRNGSLTGHMGDPDLVDVLDRVERNWHKQRHELVTFLDSAAGSVAGSLACYHQLESDLTKVAQASPE